MPQRWLVKTEPDEYSLDDLLAERRTAWEGVRNPLARRHLGSMRAGDAVLVYHTGREKAVVGTAQVGRTDAEDVELLAGRRLPRPVPLAELRADRRLAGWELLRVPRLSVMPVNETQWNTVMELAQRSSTEGRDEKPRERA